MHISKGFVFTIFGSFVNKIVNAYTLYDLIIPYLAFWMICFIILLAVWWRVVMIFYFLRVFRIFLFPFLFILFISSHTHVDHLVHWIRLAVEYTLRTVSTLLFQNKYSSYTVQSLWRSRQSVSLWNIPSFLNRLTLEMLYESSYLLQVDNNYDRNFILYMYWLRFFFLHWSTL